MLVALWLLSRSRLAKVVVTVVIVAVARFQLNRLILLTKLSKKIIQAMALTSASGISRHGEK